MTRRKLGLREVSGAPHLVQSQGAEPKLCFPPAWHVKDVSGVGGVLTEPPFLGNLGLGSRLRAQKARADGRVSVLLCEVLKKSFPTFKAAAITAGSLGSCWLPVSGPRKGPLMEARQPEHMVVEIALKTKPH